MDKDQRGLQGLKKITKLKLFIIFTVESTPAGSHTDLSDSVQKQDVGSVCVWREGSEWFT